MTAEPAGIVVIGASLLSLFIYYSFVLGFTTLLIAHVMFSISFVVVVVRSRLIGFDRHLEEAAADLGATPLATFRTVTLPLLAPGILAAALLAFALSFDEVIVTTFTGGQQSTLPIWMLEELIRPRQRPVTNVVAMVVVLVTFLPILAAYYLTRDGDQVAGAGK